MVTKVKAVLILLISFFALWFACGTKSGPMDISFGKGQKWQSIAAAKRREIMSKIPKEWLRSDNVLAEGKERKQIAGEFIERLLDSKTLNITCLDNEELLELMSSGYLSATEVISAFCKRAAYAHQLNQNLLEIAFDVGLERAKELDEYYKKHQKTVGPLHGLPVSLKDQFHVKGFETTMAYTGWVGTFEGQKGTGKEKLFESELIRELHSLGAIVIAKTTLVQSLWSGETNNNLLGYLFNPHSQKLSAGGSSGGEGAFQSLRGSAIGFGSDIGGSVAMPAAFSHVYSFKPSHGRISFKGAANSSPGQMVIPTVVGILGPSVAALRNMFKALLSSEPWLYDPEVLPLPYRAEAEYNHQRTPKFAFGVLESDGMVTPHPPIIRAVREVTKALEAEGHKVLPWNPPSHAEAQRIHRSFTRADGLHDVLENVALSGEPLVPQIRSLFEKGAPPPINVPQYYNNTLHLQGYRARYQAYWDSTAEQTGTGRPVDAVILPVAPHAAVLPGKWFWYGYASFVNVLDYTNVVVPVTKASSKIDVFDHDYKLLNEVDKNNWEAYDSVAYDGAPAAVQILGRRLEEEKILSIAPRVVEALGKHKGRARP